MELPPGDPETAMLDLAETRRTLDDALGRSADARRTIEKSFGDLQATFRRIHTGQRSEGSAQNHTDLSVLTSREVEVLRLIAEGMSTKMLAAELHISYKTAVTHRTHILQKLGVHETASLVRIAIRAGLISA